LAPFQQHQTADFGVFEGKQLDQTVLLVEYDATSPVNALETVVYGDADLLPSGMTGAEFKGIMARRRQRD
jgi:hypothetical protein